MNLFLDTSVILAACGSWHGASHAIFDLAAFNGWRLLVGRYGLAEIAENLPQLGETAAYEWAQLRTQIQVVRDISSFRWPVVFEPAKDRPVLFTAAAWADVLLTLDRADFGGLMSGGFYGFSVLKPGDFLRNERAAGRVRTS